LYYFIKVRHEKKDLLEKINDLYLLVSCKLTNPIVLDVYKSYNLAITGCKKLGSFSIKSGQTKPVYVTPVSNDKSVYCNFYIFYVILTLFFP